MYIGSAPVAGSDPLVVRCTCDPYAQGKDRRIPAQHQRLGRFTIKVRVL
jgi:hypothetical protein